MAEPRYKLGLRIYVSDRHMGGSGLTIEEEWNFDSLGGFAEMAKLIGQFHDLAEKIKAEKIKG